MKERCTPPDDRGIAVFGRGWLLLLLLLLLLVLLLLLFGVDGLDRGKAMFDATSCTMPLERRGCTG